MNRLLITLVLLLCVVGLNARSEPMSLSWWFLPDDMEDLPHEIEEGPVGFWTELWMRPAYDAEVQPRTVMEQGLGVKWLGMEPDKDGKPTEAVLVLAGRKIVSFDGEKVRAGTVAGMEITWADGKKQSLYEFRRRRRRRRSVKIKFGKMPLPPLASREKSLRPWSAEGLENFLTKFSNDGVSTPTPRDLSVVAQTANQNGSLLNFKYADSCDFQDRQEIEDALAKDVEPKLTCLMEQNVELGSKLLAVLMQKPVIECRPHAPMDLDDCGMATLPFTSAFFVGQPKIFVPTNRCVGELGDTLLHEILHLDGVPEDPKFLDEAIEESQSCRSYPAGLSFENQSEGFVNDFQVQTRIFLFRKVRDEAAAQWGWTDGEAAYLLGTICNKMGDKYCARNFFQKAADGNLTGTVEMPEGSEVTWSSLAQFQLFDSISEDINRMHELVRYLHRDPNGALLRRLETGAYRLHEFFVARSALEEIQSNKGICGPDTDEHVMCEDLAQIVKTPWFRNP